MTLATVKYELHRMAFKLSMVGTPPMSNDPRVFFDQLRNHDFWHEYSDDGDVYRRGADERRRIKAHAEGDVMLNAMWNTYSLLQRKQQFYGLEYPAFMDCVAQWRAGEPVVPPRT